MKKRTETEVDRLDAELDRWRSKRTEIDAQRQAAEQERTAIATDRERLLLAARAEDDPEAQAALAAATDRLLAVERECADLATVLTQIDGRLALLKGEHAAARRAEDATKLRALAAERLQVTAELQAAADIMRPLLARWRRIAADMDTIGQTGSYSRTHALRGGLVHALFWPEWGSFFGAPHEAFRRPLLDIEREALCGLLPDAESAETTAEVA
jgi:chromosome segregation ATPase